MGTILVIKVFQKLGELKSVIVWDIFAIHRSTKVSLTVKKKIVNMIAKKKLVQHVYTFKSRGHFCSCT